VIRANTPPETCVEISTVKYYFSYESNWNIINNFGRFIDPIMRSVAHNRYDRNHGGA
jgi:hypothetical protein